MSTNSRRRAGALDPAAIASWTADYHEVIVDLGTGDGRFVHHLARRCPERAVIGIDTCLANPRRPSRSGAANALFVVADALALPGDLHGLATAATINFPWGSLLHGLLDGHAGLVQGLHAIGRDGLSLEVRLNAGALAEAGWDFDAAGRRAVGVLAGAGFAVGPVRVMESRELRDVPTTWAKRLAFGRNPRAIHLRADLPSADGARHQAARQTGATAASDAGEAATMAWRAVSLRE